MATVVCQGLQSCLESPITEPAVSIRLKLTSPSPSPHISHLFDVPNTRQHYGPSDMATGKLGLEERLALSNKQHFAYVPPPLTGSSPLLSLSLELCTEDLGNETGTIDRVSESAVSSLSSSSPLSPTKSDDQIDTLPPAKKSRADVGARKLLVSHSFPPPLTTIRGMESLQVRPHREDGRLVIEAVKTPSNYACFRAERNQGRLRLCFVKDNQTSCPDVGGEEEEEEEEEREEEQGETSEDEIVMEEADEKDRGEENINGDKIKSDVDVFGDVKEIFQRTGGRCIEGEPENRRLLCYCWEPFWVATS